MSPTRALTVELARSAVTELAPTELPLFDRRSAAFFRRRWWARRGLLRADLGPTLASLTDAALAAAQGGVGVMVVLAADDARGWAFARLRVLLRRHGKPRRDQVWSAAQLARIRDACRAGCAGKVDEATTEAVVNAVVAQLALGGFADDRH